MHHISDRVLLSLKIARGREELFSVEGRLKQDEDEGGSTTPAT
jgi:hypothetical protein